MLESFFYKKTLPFVAFYGGKCFFFYCSEPNLINDCAIVIFLIPS